MLLSGVLRCRVDENDMVMNPREYLVKHLVVGKDALSVSKGQVLLALMSPPQEKRNAVIELPCYINTKSESNLPCFSCSVGRALALKADCHGLTTQQMFHANTRDEYE